MVERIGKIKVQLRIADIDSLNHVNNANYLTFFEIGRVDYFLNIMKIPDLNQIRIVVKQAEIEFMKPIHFTDKPLVETWISKLGKTSAIFSHRIVDEETHNLYAVGKTVIVYVDDNGRKMEIPFELKEKAEKLLLEQ